jgi:DNA polymerase II small subunit/DNA polymerase delta subunit B
MDLVMTELAAALPVDIMPGPDDPANVSLPQQPLHQCLFPGAAPYSSFRRVTNPHAFELGGCLLLGTAGQNVDDMAKYTHGRSRCAAGLAHIKQRLSLNVCLSLATTRDDVLILHTARSSV